MKEFRKEFKDPVVVANNYLREVYYLCQVKTLPGLQQLVRACPEHKVLITDYVGHTLRSTVHMSRDTKLD